MSSFPRNAPYEQDNGALASTVVLFKERVLGERRGGFSSGIKGAELAQVRGYFCKHVY